MPGDLVLGPLLRRVEGDRATIWVETARPVTVQVKAGPADGAARTFAVHGHHYALVVIDGLPTASITPYEVLIDGEVAWPPPDYTFPRPVIRTRAEDEPVRIVFGSCREASPLSVKRYPPDALDAFSVRLAALAERLAGGNARLAAGGRARLAPGAAPWPDLVMLLGDQVYADETPENIQRWLKRRRRHRRRDAPKTQVVDFHEYTKLYLDSWSDPEVRWLLSTVPTVMIFDDHEIIDDWNTSAAWRTTMTACSWWGQRIQAGLSSYWVYQHLGNLSPSALADDPVYSAVSATSDATAIMDDLGTRADAEPGSYRWSYTLDVGRTRVVVLDNRAGRELEPGKRAMLPESEWAWFAKNLPGEYDHLVIGSSLPWLMPPALHHLEAANERWCESSHRAVAAFNERIRQGFDLEHWAAFGRSFDALSALLAQIGSGHGGVSPAPATISVLSGDVHHSYAARADLGPEVSTSVHQLTCSPVHNDVPVALRPAMRFGWTGSPPRLLRGLARMAGLPKPVVRWRKLAGPYFGNAVGVLVHSGRSARVTIEGTRQDKTLAPVAALTLAEGGDPADGSAAYPADGFAVYPADESAA